MKPLLRDILKSSSLILQLIFFCISASASMKDELGVSGSLRAAAFQRDKNYNEERGYLVGSVWLQMRPEEFFDGTKFFFDGYLQGENFNRNSYSEGDVREAYLEKSFANFDLKVGRQIIVWGRADKINPTDSLSVKNLKRLTTDDEEQRLGQFATQIAYNFDSSRFIFVWQPEWRFPVFPIAPQSGISITEERPENSQNQYAIKWDKSGGDIDGSVSYYDGFSHSPDLKVLAISSNLTQLGLDFHRIKVLGADFATTIGSYGVRSEAAYTQTNDVNGDNPLQQNSFWQVVVGADKTIDNFNTNVQLVYLHVNDFVDPASISDMNLKLLASQLALNSNQQYQDNYAISLRPSYKMWNDTLETECAFIYWTKKGDSLVRPKISYAVADTLKAILGAEFYQGPSDSFFGRLKDSSTSFAEIRYLF